MRYSEIKLHEVVHPQGNYYLHVTSAENLESVLHHGLYQPDRGNYSGYEASLPGVYVTRVAAIIRQHIFVRNIDNDYLVVVVYVATPAMIDEDALDFHLQTALNGVAKQRHTDIDDLMADEEDYAMVGRAMVPFLLQALGTPIPRPGRDFKAFMAEFGSTWFSERIVGGEGADSDWWVDAKERMLRSFPNLTHQHHGNDYSLRLSSPVGFDGETRITAIVRVTDDVAKVVMGELPPTAEALVRSVTT